MSLICGHCGTEVKNGFTVCASCGANHRLDKPVLVVGIVCIILGILAFFASTLALSFKEGILIALVGIPLIAWGALNVKWGLRKKWYRYNA